MTFSLRQRRTVLSALIALLTIAYLACVMRLVNIAEDDAYIHRRIAMHLLQTGHAEFNAGERVMVSSSPLWTLLLAAAGALLGTHNPVPWLELPALLAACTAAFLLVADECAEGGVFHAFLPAIAFVLAAFAAFPSTMEQMETPWAIALMLGGCLGIARRRDWGMPLLVLACFTRYECVLMALLGAGFLTRRRRWTRTSFLLSAGLCAAGIVWLLAQYGTLIPNTVAAKSRVYILSFGQSAAMLGGSKLVLALVFGLLAVFLWTRYRVPRKDMESFAGTALVSFGVALTCLYVLKKTFIFPWYLQLVWIPLLVGVLLWTARAGRMQALAGALTAVLLVLPFARSDAALMVGVLRGKPGNTFAGGARVHEYLNIGEALQQSCPSGSLMTAEIGGLGWTFHGEILDGVGLASPDALRFHPMRVPQERSNGSTGEIPAGFVHEKRPDLIVSYDFFAESAIPSALRMGYADYTYPLFLRQDRDRMHGLWNAKYMHVLVSPTGRCSPQIVGQSVKSALER